MAKKLQAIVWLGFRPSVGCRNDVFALGGSYKMLTLVVGFIGMVLLPALILSLVMARFNRAPSEFPLQEDDLRFRISSDAK